MNELEERILKEAAEEAEKILHEARHAAKKVILAAEEEAEKISQAAAVQGKKDAERLKRSLLTPVRLEAKKKVLEEKQKMLDSVFEGCSPEKREQKEIEAAK
ncbi:MAG: hypothetical protein L0213_04130, partial [Candidatus Dadabacteria bacterium]|nr:hypothetical protein [Candidatus Dadabacteria bacterium]